MTTASKTQSVPRVYQLQTFVRRHLADTITPVSIYLKVRDHFGSAVLLESTDFRSMENCFSFIGIEPMASFQVQAAQVSYWYPDGQRKQENIDNYT
ncbi:MAG: anthranilate synthase component I family protein, partial [Bacteroidota bacterium]